MSLSFQASSATLPQELTDLIVEKLGLDGDIKSLIACLTVSKAFFPMARACLWRDRFIGPYRDSERHGLVKWSIDKIPESPILRSLVRSMCICLENWSIRGDKNFWESELSIVVEAFEHVNHLELNLPHLLPDRVPASLAIRKWHIVSLKLSHFGVTPNRWPTVTHTAANSCAFFENFPMLNHVELEDNFYIGKESALCTGETHHKLPQPVSLALYDYYSPTVRDIIAAGHLFSLKKLRTLELDYTMDEDLLLDAVAGTVKELVIRTITWEHGYSLPFHRVESILFSLDTDDEARGMLKGWTRVMAYNSSNNTVQKVTIEIELDWEPGRTAPKIRFPKEWTKFGKALGGLVALKELVIIYQPGRGDRIGNTDDAATRAGVTEFLRGKLGPITDSTHVRLAFIDRNV